MSQESILITGGAGFIGSNFIPYFLEKHQDRYHVINLDLLTYAGDLANLEEASNNSNYTFVKGDIRDQELIATLFKRHDIRHVLHFAAESHVDNSIKGPMNFVTTNMLGTSILVEAARNHWMSAPHQYKAGYENSRFHHISTDEVYGTLGPEGYFVETTPYAPNSPYSASKAGSDLMVRSYFHTFGLNVVTTNCSNNYGPKQHDEKLIPTILRNALKGNPIPIYGKGENVRDWLFVIDHCSAIDTVFHKGRAGETYNVGGDCERTNISLCLTICRTLDKIHPKKDGKYEDLITYVSDRPGHDLRYAIDASKMKNELGWNPATTIENGLDQTLRWYLKKYL